MFDVVCGRLLLLVIVVACLSLIGVCLLLVVVFGHAFVFEFFLRFLVCYFRLWVFAVVIG